MFVVKCDTCGFEQVVKKRIDNETFEALKTNNGLYCNRVVCDSRSKKTPEGCYKIWGIFGGWTVMQLINLETYKSVKRAREILEIDLAQVNLTD